MTFHQLIHTGTRSIGSSHPCYCIAEAGSNHNNDIGMAFRLIETAASAGADAVKFQLFKADKLYPKQAGKPNYLKDQDDIHSLIKSMELPPSWLPRLQQCCEQNRIEFIVTPFDPEAVSLLSRHVHLFKLSSYELNHYPLVEALAREKKPILMSSGAATTEDIAETLDFFRVSGILDIVVLHCIAAYPAPIEQTNLRSIPFIAERFGVLAGYSDHSEDPLIAPLAALALGAVVIEKHFTLDRNLPGPDHSFALEPPQLSSMIAAIRKMQTCFGSLSKDVQPCEQELHRFAKPVIFAGAEISSGELFSEDNLVVLRRGNSNGRIHPRHFRTLIGTRSRLSYRLGDPIDSMELSIPEAILPLKQPPTNGNR